MYQEELTLNNIKYQKTKPNHSLSLYPRSSVKEGSDYMYSMYLLFFLGGVPLLANIFPLLSFLLFGANFVNSKLCKSMKLIIIIFYFLLL